jgi:hypothetical protein
MTGEERERRVGWVEPSRNPSPSQTATDGYRFAPPILREVYLRYPLIRSARAAASITPSEAVGADAIT